MIKNLIRSGLNYFHLDLTKNLEYDRLTKRIMKMIIKKNSNCIDVGCHKGEILDKILQLSPEGKHYAFEPIPKLYDYLRQKYSTKCRIYPFALSDKNKISKFKYVISTPSYSGIKERKYNVSNPKIQEIDVELKVLDDVIPHNVKIDFIKIDVEGGEFGVLRGAKKLLKKNKPVIIFECGLGASDYYGTKPIELYNFLKTEADLNIFTLKDWINKKEKLSERIFIECFNSNKEYYFIAHP